MASSTYDLFEQAIRLRKPVSWTYRGRVRALCPVILGHSDGEKKALTYQFGGETNSALPKGGEWRCLLLSGGSDARLFDGPWRSGDSHTQQSACVKEVDLDVN